MFFLNEEKAVFMKKWTSHTQAFFKKPLFEEMKFENKEDDSSVPYTLNGFTGIATRYEVGEGVFLLYSRNKGLGLGTAC